MPGGASLAEIETVARDKQLWVHTKLAEKQLLAQPYRPKEYLAGEGFYYLGKSYRLRFVDPDPTSIPLRLYQGRFELRRDKVERGREHFIH